MRPSAVQPSRRSRPGRVPTPESGVGRRGRGGAAGSDRRLDLVAARRPRTADGSPRLSGSRAERRRHGLAGSRVHEAGRRRRRRRRPSPRRARPTSRRPRPPSRPGPGRSGSPSRRPRSSARRCRRSGTSNSGLDRGHRLAGVAVRQQPGLLAAHRGALGDLGLGRARPGRGRRAAQSAARARGRRGWPRRRPGSRPSRAGRCGARRARGSGAGATGAASVPTARRSRDRARLAGTDPARMDVSPRLVLPSFSLVASEVS